MQRAAIFEIFPSGTGFAWHVKRGGRIIAASREKYLRRRGAMRAIKNLASAIALTKFRVDSIETKPKAKK